MLTRRRWLALAGAVSIFVLAGRGHAARVAAPADVGPGLQAALASSSLVYLTPLHADGRESTCQAEVWFVAEGETAYVVTATGAWRARAVRRGLASARMWIGEAGVWTRSNGAYRDLPSVLVRATEVTDPAVHARLLDTFSRKYRMGWVFWGSRFRRGLADGSRVMLRYDADGTTA